MKSYKYSGLVTKGALTRFLVYNLLQCIANGAAGGKDYNKTIYFISFTILIMVNSCLFSFILIM